MHTSTESHGGDGLLFLIAMAVVTVVTVECLFIAFASWWLMSLVLLLVIVAAIGVCAALVRLIEDDTPVAAPRRKPEVAPASAAVRAAPAPSPRVIAHSRP
jgi:hypothetical protein